MDRIMYIVRAIEDRFQMLWRSTIRFNGMERDGKRRKDINSGKSGKEVPPSLYIAMLLYRFEISMYPTNNNNNNNNNNMGFCYTAQAEQGQSRQADSDTDPHQSGMPQTKYPRRYY